MIRKVLYNKRSQMNKSPKLYTQTKHSISFILKLSKELYEEINRQTEKWQWGFTQNLARKLNGAIHGKLHGVKHNETMTQAWFPNSPLQCVKYSIN